MKELNEFHYCEFIDRCFCVGNIIDNVLKEHPVYLDGNKKLLEHIDKASEHIAIAYQIAGNLEYSFEKSKD